MSRKQRCAKFQDCAETSTKYSLQFEFLGAADKEGSFPVKIHPIEVEEVRKQAESDIEFAALDGEDGCSSGWHSERCQVRMEHAAELCIELQAEHARKRLKKLYSLDMLTQCVRTPQIANGERTMEGMALSSIVFETR